MRKKTSQMRFYLARVTLIGIGGQEMTNFHFLSQDTTPKSSTESFPHDVFSQASRYQTEALAFREQFPEKVANALRCWTDGGDTLDKESQPALSKMTGLLLPEVLHSFVTSTPFIKRVSDNKRKTRSRCGSF